MKGNPVLTLLVALLGAAIVAGGIAWLDVPAASPLAGTSDAQVRELRVEIDGLRRQVATLAASANRPVSVERVAEAGPSVDEDLAALDVPQVQDPLINEKKASLQTEIQRVHDSIREMEQNHFTDKWPVLRQLKAELARLVEEASALPDTR